MGFAILGGGWGSWNNPLWTPRDNWIVQDEKWREGFFIEGFSDAPKSSSLWV